MYTPADWEWLKFLKSDKAYAEDQLLSQWIVAEIDPGNVRIWIRMP